MSWGDTQCLLVLLFLDILCHWQRLTKEEEVFRKVFKTPKGRCSILGLILSKETPIKISLEPFFTLELNLSLVEKPEVLP